MIRSIRPRLFVFTLLLPIMLLPANDALAVTNNGSCTDSDGILGAIWAELFSGGDILAEGRPELLALEPSGSGSKVEPMRVGSIGWREGWMGKAPPAALVGRWYADPASDWRCVRAQAELRGIQTVGESGAAGILSKWSGTGNGPAIVRIRVITGSSDKALVVYSKESHSMGGRTEIYYIERAKGIWQRAGFKILSIS